MTPYELPHWFTTSSQNESTRLRLYFDDIEKPDPITGYEGRDTGWFDRCILPDFLETKARLGLGPTLLDVGCAFGYFTRRFAEHFTYVLGVDFSETRIAGAKEHNSRPNIDYLTFDLVSGRLEMHDDRATAGRGDGTPYRMDSAVSSAVIQHIPPSERVTAFTTIQRALRPGGKLVMYDECLQDRPGKWDGFYEALSPQWIRAQLSGVWVLDACDFVAAGVTGEHIHRYELSTP